MSRLDGVKKIPDGREDALKTDECCPARIARCFQLPLKSGALVCEIHSSQGSSGKISPTRSASAVNASSDAPLPRAIMIQTPETFFSRIASFSSLVCRFPPGHRYQCLSFPWPGRQRRRNHLQRQELDDRIRNVNQRDAMWQANLHTMGLKTLNMDCHDSDIQKSRPSI